MTEDLEPGEAPPPFDGYGGRGGHSAYGGYGSSPAPRPGLIPLRPLTLGEILDGAFTAIRWNPKTILASSALAAAITGVLVGLMAYFVRDSTIAHVAVPATGGTLNLPGSAGTATLVGVTVLVACFSNAILAGLLAVVIGQGVLGRKETPGSAWRATRPRIGALLAMVALAAGCLVLGGGAVAGLLVAAGALLSTGAHLPAVGAIVGTGGVVTVVALAGITLARWSLAIPVVMLEHARPLASLRRSWQLARRSSWRVLGILLVANLIVSTASATISLPFRLASGVSGIPQAHVSITSAIVFAIGQVVALTVSAPLLAGVVVLLYADLRMRREGMDIALRAAAAAAPGGGTAGGEGHGPW